MAEEHAIGARRVLAGMASMNERRPAVALIVAASRRLRNNGKISNSLSLREMRDSSSPLIFQPRLRH
jgi:hypothetical protein